MYEKLDPLLHSQLRLTIMAHLVRHQEMSFTDVKALTKASAGNISVQVQKLEKEKYIEIHKGFKGNYQHTTLKLTTKGLDAFETYVQALRSYIDPQDDTE